MAIRVPQHCIISLSQTEVDRSYCPNSCGFELVALIFSSWHTVEVFKQTQRHAYSSMMIVMMSFATKSMHQFWKHYLQQLSACRLRVVNTTQGDCRSISRIDRPLANCSLLKRTAPKCDAAMRRPPVPTNGSTTSCPARIRACSRCLRKKSASQLPHHPPAGIIQYWIAESWHAFIDSYYTHLVHVELSNN